MHAPLYTALWCCGRQSTNWTLLKKSVDPDLREHIPESIAHGITGSECSLGLRRRMWIPQAEANHHSMSNKTACLLGIRFMELLVLFLITIAVLGITVVVGLRLPKKQGENTLDLGGARR